MFQLSANIGKLKGTRNEQAPCTARGTYSLWTVCGEELYMEFTFGYLCVGGLTALSKDLGNRDTIGEYNEECARDGNGTQTIRDG
jgi:hypothetical protein